MNASFTASMLVILTAECREIESTPFPSLAPRDATSPSSIFYRSMHPSGQTALVLPSAVHSKMSPGLLSVLRPSAITAEPTPSPSQSTPTTYPTLGKQLYFTPAYLADEQVLFSGTEVKCISDVESKAPLRSIEFLYFYQIKTATLSDDDFLRKIESYLLTALAENILTCANEENEDIRRLVSEAGAEQARVVAAHSLPENTVSNEYSCPAGDLYSRSCHIVEGKVLVTIEVGDEEKYGAILSSIDTVIRLAFLALNDQGATQVSYIGNDPFSLTSVGKPRTGNETSANGAGIFVTVFLVVCACGVAVAIVALVAFLSAHANERNGKYDGAMGEGGNESIGIPSSIEITLSTSSDEIGGGPLQHHHSNLLVTAEEAVPPGAPNKGIVFSNLRLSRVPEEESVTHFECDEISW